MGAEPSQTDIARAAGVSRNTVSLALRNSPRLPITTRERIHQIARSLGYRPNPEVARAMTAVAKSRSAKRETLALLYLRSRDELMSWNSFHLIEQAFIARAHEVGFGVDTFQLSLGDHKGLDVPQLCRQLRARGIRGVGLLGAWHWRLEDRLEPLWREFAVASASAVVREPPISHAMAGFFDGAYLALKVALERGYQRCAFMVEDTFDRRINYQLSSGFAAATRELLGSDHPLLYIGRENRKGNEEAHRWLSQQHADCVIAMKEDFIESLMARGLRQGLIRMDHSPDQTNVAGIDLRNEVSGQACVDLLEGQLGRLEIGIPAVHKTVTSNPIFRDGPTLPDLAR